MSRKNMKFNFSTIPLILVTLCYFIFVVKGICVSDKAARDEIEEYPSSKTTVKYHQFINGTSPVHTKDKFNSDVFAQWSRETIVFELSFCL